MRFPNALELKPIESQTKSINIQIIPKLELFHIMAYLSNSNHLNNFELQYKSEINSFFEPFRNQNAVFFVNKVLQNYHAHLLINGFIVNNNFSKDSSSVNFLNVNDFELENNYSNKVLILDSLTKTIDSFAKITNFNKFIENHESYYKQKIAEVAQMVLQMEKQQGYIYNDVILELIKDYSVNRSIYKNFDDYMPILITKLDQQIK